ncbi:MAG TPA: SDR family oxidoreductase [Candidatus Nanoarchaeia archaeon]|nr:SDR family oxidoreductase [Candidatus Nanoarchaeia archaeon]
MAIHIDFEGKTVIIAGVGDGLGRALVRYIPEHNGRVIALSNDPEVLASIDADNDTIQKHDVDLADEALTKVVFKRIGETNSDIRGLVNTAYVPHYVTNTLGISKADVMRVFEHNFYAALHASQLAISLMLRNNPTTVVPDTFGGVTGVRGNIVTIGSILAGYGDRGKPVYAASKAAVASLAHSLAVDWGRAGIVSVLIEPGNIITPSNPLQGEVDDSGYTLARRRAFDESTTLGRSGSLEEIVPLVAEYLDPSRAYASGTTVRFDAGHRDAVFRWRGFEHGLVEEGRYDHADLPHRLDLDLKKK